MKKVSVLQKLYLSVTPHQAAHFKKQWLKYFDLSVQSWHNRLAKPTFEDYVLWHYVNGAKLTDFVFAEAIEMYENAFFVAGVTKYELVKNEAFKVNANGLLK